MPIMLILCACGCGEEFIPFDSRGRGQKYIYGHSKHMLINTWKPPESKMCNLCKLTKPAGEFGQKKYRSRLTGEAYFRLQPLCRPCHVTSIVEPTKTPERRAERRAKRHRNRQKIGTWLSEKLTDWKLKTKGSDLTSAYLMVLYEKQGGRCYYTDILMGFIAAGHDRWDSITLDRLDPKKGYMQGNVVFCTYRVNMWKGQMQESDFYELMRTILQHRNQDISPVLDNKSESIAKPLA